MASKKIKSVYYWKDVKIRKEAEIVGNRAAGRKYMWQNYVLSTGTKKKKLKCILERNELCDVKLQNIFNKNLYI